VNERTTASFLLGVTVIAWGLNYRATAIGVGHTSALMFGALRTAPPVVVFLALAGLGVIRLPRGRLALTAGATGVVMVTFFVYALSEGVVRAGAGNTAVLVNSSPLWVALLSRPLFGERLRGLAVGGLVLGFGGVVLMFSSELQVGGGDVAIGMAIALAGGVAWAVGTVAVKSFSQRDDPPDPRGVLTLQYTVGSPLLLLIAFAIDGTSGTDWSSGELWGAVLFIAAAAAIGSVAFYGALQHLPATQTAAVQFLVPVVAVLVELARGNIPAALTVAGMALAVAGVALVNVPRSSPARAVATDLRGRDSLRPG
jgi:drug/metabolite transporter (DMT)-like permease